MALDDMALDEVSANAADAADAAFKPTADIAAEMAGDSAVEGAGDAAADGAGNALMWAKAAYTVGSKLKESGVMASETAGGPTLNMDSSAAISNIVKKKGGPLGLDEYNNTGAFAPAVGVA